MVKRKIASYTVSLLSQQCSRVVHVDERTANRFDANTMRPRHENDIGCAGVAAMCPACFAPDVVPAGAQVAP